MGRAETYVGVGGLRMKEQEERTQKTEHILAGI
jgi:hypothetical protein